MASEPQKQATDADDAYSVVAAMIKNTRKERGILYMGATSVDGAEAPSLPVPIQGRPASEGPMSALAPTPVSAPAPAVEPQIITADAYSAVAAMIKNTRKERGILYMGTTSVDGAEAPSVPDPIQERAPP